MTRSLIAFLPIGREDSSLFGSDGREETRWIGKPWRRIELLTFRHFWKGEQTEVERTLTLHLGSRRLGLFVSFTITRARRFDYSDEPHV